MKNTLLKSETADRSEAESGSRVPASRAPAPSPLAEDQSDSKYVICPYCEYEYQPDAETRSEDQQEERCNDCGMKFYRTDSFTIEYKTRGDCELNGIEHDFQLKTFQSGESAYFCENCGICRLNSFIIRGFQFSPCYSGDRITPSNFRHGLKSSPVPVRS